MPFEKYVYLSRGKWCLIFVWKGQIYRSFYMHINNRHYYLGNRIFIVAQQNYASFTIGRTRIEIGRSFIPTVAFNGFIVILDDCWHA